MAALRAAAPILRDQEVGGSNPLAPTKFLFKISYLGTRYFGLEGSKRAFALFVHSSIKAAGCHDVVAANHLRNSAEPQATLIPEPHAPRRRGPMHFSGFRGAGLEPL
jgi:hypothetical protein